MKKIYIDFDSTLYDTGLFKKNFLLEMAKEICKKNHSDDVETTIKEILDFKQDKKAVGILSFCDIVSEKYDIEMPILVECVKRALAKGEELYYDDSVQFLKSLAQKGYEINILTYTLKRDFEFQLLKLSGAKIASLVNNIFICTSNKGELSLDYKNATFIDDNPRDLTSLFEAGVSADRLIRVKRTGAKYSNVELNEFVPFECERLDEIKI